MNIEEQYDKIYRYCYFKVYDAQLAQDLTQEAFLRFYKQDLNLNKSKELPYLYTIAKLPPEEQELLFLRYVTDLSITFICTINKC